MTIPASSRVRAAAGRALLVLCLLHASGCTGDFTTGRPSLERLYDIDPLRLTERSRTPPVPVTDASDPRVAERLLAAPVGPELPVDLEGVRAASLANNLDLDVRLIDPTIAAQAVDVEEAKFESTFRGSFNKSRTDSPTALGTEGSKVDFTRSSAGVNVPLRTGGSINIDFPLTETETDNPFALLDPSYTADLRFSLSQELLRNAGQRVNTHSIRVAKYQEDITSARTKLEAIRILANADRAYWRLYAAQRQLEVRQLEYELAVEQLERAKRQTVAGISAEVEVIRAQSGVAQRVELIITVQNLIRRRERDLKRIMNRPDLPMESETRLILQSAPDPLQLDLDDTELAEYALANRMEMLELELQLAIDLSTIEFQKNQTLPLITLDYTYNINGLGETYNDVLDQIPDHSFEDWSVGLNASVPIGNEAARARLNQAMLTRIQRLASRLLREQAIRQEVYDSVDLLRDNWYRIMAARLDVLLQGRTYDAELRQFEQGTRTSTDVLDASARLANARSREINAVIDYQIAQIDLAFATGTLLGYSKVEWAPSSGDLPTP